MLKFWVIRYQRAKRDRYGTKFYPWCVGVQRDDLTLVENRVSRGDQLVTALLSPLEADVLAALMLNRRFVSKEELMVYLWPEAGTEPENYDSNLSVYVHMLRKKLSRLGVIILNWHGMGWKLSW